MGDQQLVSLQLREQFSSPVLSSRAKTIYGLSLWKGEGRAGEENPNPTDSETLPLFKHQAHRLTLRYTFPFTALKLK